jgi:uncharacterized integral membrane protein
MTLLRWIITLPLIVGAVLFAMANAETVTFTWNPFQTETELPLYAVAFMFLGIGFFIGALTAWVGMSNIRQEKRRLKKENKQLEKDINIANEKLIEELSKKETKVIEHHEY